MANQAVQQVNGCRPDCEVCTPDDGRQFAAGQLLADDSPVPHGCDWCACGVGFDPDWMEQRGPLFNEPPPPARTERRGLFGRRRCT